MQPFLAERCLCFENHALVLNIWYHINTFMKPDKKIWAVVHMKNVSSKYVKERKGNEWWLETYSGHRCWVVFNPDCWLVSFLALCDITGAQVLFFEQFFKVELTFKTMFQCKFRIDRFDVVTVTHVRLPFVHYRNEHVCTVAPLVQTV